MLKTLTGIGFLLFLLTFGLLVWQSLFYLQARRANRDFDMEIAEESLGGRRKPRARSSGGLTRGYSLKAQANFSGVRLAMQVIVTLAVGGAAVYIALSRRFDPGEREWASCTIGTLIGFWLKV